MTVDFYDETVAHDMLRISSHRLEFGVSLLDFAYQPAGVHRLIDSRFQEVKIVMQRICLFRIVGMGPGQIRFDRRNPLATGELVEP